MAQTKSDLIQKYRGLQGPKAIQGTKGWYVTKEKEINMKEIIDALSDAILATGKRFEEIPKSSITSYLDKVGVSKNKHEEIYKKLTEIYNVNPKVKTTDHSKDKTPSPKVVHTSVTTKTKERQPRKNVFSEITKIH
jgi:hypothetical protein